MVVSRVPVKIFADDRSAIVTMAMFAMLLAVVFYPKIVRQFCHVFFVFINLINVFNNFFRCFHFELKVATPQRSITHYAVVIAREHVIETQFHTVFQAVFLVAIVYHH